MSDVLLFVLEHAGATSTLSRKLMAASTISRLAAAAFPGGGVDVNATAVAASPEAMTVSDRMVAGLTVLEVRAAPTTDDTSHLNAEG